MSPPRSYIPIRRAGVGKSYPPDDTWSIADLAAELAFWRNYAALRAFAVPRNTPTPVRMPAQQARNHARWDRLVESAFGVSPNSAARRPPRRREQGCL